MVYERVRGWTSGRSLPVQNFKYPPGSSSRRVRYSFDLKVFRLQWTDVRYKSLYISGVYAGTGKLCIFGNLGLVLF